jgi:SAM-dependent methyltransferase
MLGLSKLVEVGRELIPYIPFTRRNILWRLVDKSGKTILDLGCGEGVPMKFINRRRKFVTTGVDAHYPYLMGCRLHGIYDYLCCCDIRALPFRRKSFDVVLCLQVLEHLEKREALSLLQQIEQLANRQVVLDVPVREWKQGTYDNNPFQRHKSAWYPVDLKRLGYKVRGYDVTYMLGQFLQSFPNGFRLIYYIVSLLATPLVYFLPRLAGSMICVKDLSFERQEIA